MQGAWRASDRRPPLLLFPLWCSFMLGCGVGWRPLRARNPSLGMLPKTKSASKCVRVVARAAACRQLLEVLYVPAAQDHVVWFKRGDQSRYDILDIPPP